MGAVAGLFSVIYLISFMNKYFCIFPLFPIHCLFGVYCVQQGYKEHDWVLFCLFWNCGTMSPALALYNFSSKTVINLYSHHHPVQQGTSTCQFDRQNLYYLVLILLVLLVLILLVLLEGRINIEKYFINNSDVWRIWTF